MVEVEKISAILPKGWKKLFHSGVVIPAKMRFCNKCSKEKCCDRCINRINENTNFFADLHFLKRQAPSQFGSMLPYHKL